MNIQRSLRTTTTPNSQHPLEGRAPLTPALSLVSGEREGAARHLSRWWVLLATLVALAVVLVFSGCALTVQKTQVVTPPVWSVGKNTNGVVVTNLVSPATVTTTWQRERPLLPPGYAVIIESDVYGIKVSFPTAQNPSPNVSAGIEHSSTTWLPTSTNRLYTLKFAKGGSIQNKAVPFWMGTSAWFITEDEWSFQGVDTNGNAFSRVGSLANTNNLTQ